jgi:hypothetical protein
MNVGCIQSVVGTLKLPEAVRALSSLPCLDYADQFTLSTDAGYDVTAERWARAMFGNVPSFGELLIWHGLLGFRLSRGQSPATVAGWKIGGRGKDWVRLEATSWFLVGNLVVQKAHGKVSLATFLHYRWWLGHVVWFLSSAVHRLLVPRVLRSAVAKIGASR